MGFVVLTLADHMAQLYAFQGSPSRFEWNPIEANGLFEKARSRFPLLESVGEYFGIATTHQSH